MLNEILAIEQGLAAAGKVVESRHEDIKDLAKSEVIRIRLNSQGILNRIELLPKGARGALWTLRDGQHNGFPGLKLPAPSLAARAKHDEIWKSAGSATPKRAEIVRFIQQRRQDPEILSWPKPAHRQRIRERLSQLLPLDQEPLTASVPATFTRFLQSLDADPPVVVAIFDTFLEELNEDEVWLDPIRGALIGVTALAMDVAADDFERDAGDLRQIGPVSAALQKNTGSSRSTNEGYGYCALSGGFTRLLDGNFPQPNLPGLGQTYLFARNKDIPALSRYGRVGASSLAIDAELAGRLSGVILELPSAEREGNT